MSPLSTAQLTALHDQHSIQGDDLALICHLANVEGIFEGIESWSFEQFLGFTLHVFITTDSQYVREQIALKLPKFGSVVVRSLIKIAHHAQSSSNVKALALQSLDSMAPYSVVIGLARMLEDESASDLSPIVIRSLATRVRKSDKKILRLLPQLLSQQNWQLVKAHIFPKISYSGLRARVTNGGEPLRIPLVVNQADIDRQPEKTPLQATHLSACS
ncbi:MAG: hypothetical protein WBD47_22460 [Phormidesmis sp.]